MTGDIFEKEFNTKIDGLIGYIWSIATWLDEQDVADRNRVQIISNQLELYVAELEDFKKGRYEPCD